MLRPALRSSHVPLVDHRLDPALRSIVRESAIQNTWTDFDEENTRIAIAMSLDLHHAVPRIVGHLTDDVPDYEIETMFSGAVEIDTLDDEDGF